MNIYNKGDIVEPRGSFRIVGYYLDTHESKIQMDLSSTTITTFRVSSLIFNIRRKYIFQQPDMSYKIKNKLVYQFKLEGCYYLVILGPNYRESGKARLINVKTKESTPYYFTELKKPSIEDQPGFDLIHPKKTYPAKKLRGVITKMYVIERRSKRHKPYYSEVKTINDKLREELKNSPHIFRLYIEIQLKNWSYEISPYKIKKVNHG